MSKSRSFNVADRTVVVTGFFPRVARIQSEFFLPPLEAPDAFPEKLKAAGIRADIFTFLARSPDACSRYPLPVSFDKKSVLRLETYDHWWTKQINDKTRNMVRKAGKKGVVVNVVPLDDELVRGIQEIYNETPIRQGRRFKHYGKDLETIRAEHATFADQSDFIGAHLDRELIGFAKLVHVGDASILMQIIAKHSHRDKAAMNALLAKAVELTTQRGAPLLFYGSWARRGLGDFRKHSGFECMGLPRFYVPLNARGRLCVRLHLHRPLAETLGEKMPEGLVQFLADVRSRWYAFRFRRPVM